MATTDIIKIQAIRLGKLNLKEFSNFVNRVFELLGTATPAELGFTPESYTAFMNDMMLLRDIVSQSHISDQTAKMAELENTRDDLVVYLLTVIRTARTSPIAAIKAAGIPLYNATKPYIGIQNLPNQQETSLIIGLINDVSKAENTAHVLALRLADTIEALDDANNGYARLTAERTAERTATQLEQGKTVRLRLEALYDNITTLIFVKSVSAPNAKTAAFVTNLNALIHEIESLYNLRIGIAKANKEKKTEEKP